MPQKMHGPNNPTPKEWLAKDLSLQYIADYKAFNFVDGEGVRCSLYVSGCHFTALVATMWRHKIFTMANLTLKNWKIRLLKISVKIMCRD